MVEGFGEPCSPRLGELPRANVTFRPHHWNRSTFAFVTNWGVVFRGDPIHQVAKGLRGWAGRGRSRSLFHSDFRRKGLATSGAVNALAPFSKP